MKIKSMTKKLKSKTTKALSGMEYEMSPKPRYRVAKAHK
jgi:hypothetical protein